MKSLSPIDLENQKVIITGGSSGIGLAVAKMVVACGVKVILVARNAQKLEAAQKEVGKNCETVVLDVTDEQAVKTFFDQQSEIHHLITAAAGTLRGNVADLDTQAARNLFESKYWGQYHCVKYAIPKMAQNGSVVLFSGWISRKPMAGVSTLAAIDAAIEALGRTLALEIAPIRVNVLTPGMIDTPLWGARMGKAEQSKHFENIGKQLPVGRAGLPEDIAHAALFLIQNGFMTGAVLDIDGGQK